MTKRVLTVLTLVLSSTILTMGAASAAPAPPSSATATAPVTSDSLGNLVEGVTGSITGGKNKGGLLGGALIPGLL